MSAKIIVGKYDNDNNFQCLDIIIDDEDNFSTKANFGQWTEGKVNSKKKESEKSTRLIVKIVLDNDLDNLDLDNCAKELHGVEQHLLNSPMLAENYDFSLNNRNTKIPKDYFSHLIRITDQKKLAYDCNENLSRKNNFMPLKDFDYSDRMSPLEYGLEKVKETNANIMKNIQMLNRTLNYTKKREMLDIVCPKSSRMFPCNACGKCFVYETGLKRHCAMRHAIVEMQPRWQVVWTCIECFQVWPCQEVASKHALHCNSNTEDCIREIKTSSLLQCEFCEKVFTSIPRLLRHSKVHTIAYNYQCNACELNFSSYKTAEQHWLSCQWLRMYYRFSLPKHYLCNACDRKFRNYEQLYNHRYKAEHFIAKYNNVNGSKTPFYQCEICGQCFPSTAHLHLHRNQYHPCFGTGTGMQGHIMAS